MYPNLYYAFKDLFGVDWGYLRLINSFGFFVAISFICAATTLSLELKRKERLGLLFPEEKMVIVGKPASFASILSNFILGFLLGFKFIGLFISSSPLAQNPQDFIFSYEGSWPAGLICGILIAGLHFWEKNRHKLPQPEERKFRLWPHDRVGDLTIYAAIFGFLGAKIFNSFETWDDFVRNPVASLF
jgi:prolipoprotein diacylglyceryltransferase